MSERFKKKNPLKDFISPMVSNENPTVIEKFDKHYKRNQLPKNCMNYDDYVKLITDQYQKFLDNYGDLDFEDKFRIDMDNSKGFLEIVMIEFETGIKLILRSPFKNELFFSSLYINTSLIGTTKERISRHQPTKPLFFNNYLTQEKNEQKINVLTKRILRNSDKYRSENYGISLRTLRTDSNSPKNNSLTKVEIDIHLQYKNK